MELVELLLTAATAATAARSSAVAVVVAVEEEEEEAQLPLLRWLPRVSPKRNRDPPRVAFCDSP